MAGYLAESAQVRGTFDRRYDDVKSGRVKPIDGGCAIEKKTTSKKLFAFDVPSCRDDFIRRSAAERLAPVPGGRQENRYARRREFSGSIDCEARAQAD